MDLMDLIEESRTFDQPCKHAARLGGHSIYCDSQDKSAPRKCTYRMHPENMNECPLFSRNVAETEEFKQLQRDLLKHKKFYYVDDSPVIGDYAYDCLERESRRMAKRLGFRVDTFEDPEENEAHHVHWMVGYKEGSIYNK
jgi:hypothetical protein